MRAMKGKGIYLVIDGLLPTCHPNLKEAKDYYKHFIKSLATKKKINAMYCEYIKEEFDDCFCNCIFKSL